MSLPRFGPLRIHGLPFTLLCGALVTFASFATDMGLPVLGATAADLGVPAGDAALTLSVFLAGYALGPLAFGPISDQRGRRPVLLAGAALFAVCGAFAAFATSLGALLAWRLAMGAGAGACQVLVTAMVRDLFDGVEARVRQSYVNLASGIAPIIAPTLGVAVAALGGWRAIYAALATGATAMLAIAWLTLGETLHVRRRAPLSLGATLRSYARVLGHPVSLGYTLVVALNFGSLFAYVSGSSLVLIELLGVSRRSYGLLFAITSFGLIVGAFTNARLARHGVSHARLILVGQSGIVLAAFALLALSLVGTLGPRTMVAVALIGFIGHGVVRPNAAQGALEPMPDIAGVASAVLSAVQMLLGALAGTVVAALFDGRSATAVTGVMAVCSSSSMLVYLLVVRRAVQRLHGTSGAGSSPTYGT